MRVLDSLVRIVESVSKWAGLLSSFLIPIIIAVIFYEVIARYLFNSPTLWSNETSLFLFGAIILLGGPYTLLNEGHIKVDVFYERWSARTKAAVDLVSFSFFFLFLGLILWKGSAFFWQSWGVKEYSWSQWGPPVYPVKLLIPLGALLMLLQGLSKFIKDFIIVVKKG